MDKTRYQRNTSISPMAPTPPPPSPFSTHRVTPPAALDRPTEGRPASGAVQCVWPWSPGWRADRVGVGPTAAGRRRSAGRLGSIGTASRLPAAGPATSALCAAATDRPKGVLDVGYSVHEVPLPDSGGEGRVDECFPGPAPPRPVSLRHFPSWLEQSRFVWLILP